MRHLADFIIETKSQGMIRIKDVVGYKESGSFFYMEFIGVPKPSSKEHPFGYFQYETKRINIEDIISIDSTVKQVFGSDKEKTDFIEKVVLGMNVPVKTEQKADPLKRVKEKLKNEKN